MKLETEILTFIDKTGCIKCKGACGVSGGTRFECPTPSTGAQEHRRTMTTTKNK